MKMNSAKRVLSLILAAVLLLGNIPATAFATEEDGSISATEAVVETMEPTAAVTEPPAEETAAPTEETAAPTEETAAPSEAVEPTEATVSDEAAMAAATVVASGKCGANLTWTLDSEGVLIIFGTGAMYDYTEVDGTDVDMPPWHKMYGRSIISVVIADGVTRIGDAAFCYCNLLSEVSIPDSVTSIGRYAF